MAFSAFSCLRRKSAGTIDRLQAEGGCTDGEPIFIACGNPTRNTGKFARITFGNERERWTRFSVDSRNSKFTNKQQIAEWIQDY